MLWTLYKVGDKVFLRNRLLNPEIAKSLSPTVNIFEFNSKNCYQVVTPRLVNKKGEAIDRYGDKIGEWSIPLSEI
jgi:hypothetical protein